MQDFPMDSQKRLNPVQKKGGDLKQANSSLRTYPNAMRNHGIQVQISAAFPCWVFYSFPKCWQNLILTCFPAVLLGKVFHIYSFPTPIVNSHRLLKNHPPKCQTSVKWICRLALSGTIYTVIFGMVRFSPPSFRLFSSLSPFLQIALFILFLLMREWLAMVISYMCDIDLAHWSFLPQVHVRLASKTAIEILDKRNNENNVIDSEMES